MPLIHDIFTASNIAGYYNEAHRDVDQSLGQRLFPADKQLGLELSYIKGAGGVPVVLKASKFDTKATIRDRMNIELTKENMPLFRESMLVKEKDRQELNTIGQTGNQQLIDMITSRIFNDKATLLTGAHARLEAMRMRVLATGKIDTISDGVALDYDYGVPEENKGTVVTAWSDSANADPLNDIENAIEALEELGQKAEAMILNKQTFALIRKAEATQAYIDPDGGKVTRKDVINYIQDELGVRVEFKDDVYVDDDGQTKKYFPDGRVTFVPNATLGRTVFGTTPEESDLVSGYNLNIEIVDTGIAIYAKTTNDPVNVQTFVSMITLPSFESLNAVYMLNVDPTAGDEPVED